MDVYMAQLRQRIAEPTRTSWWKAFMTEFMPTHAYAIGGFAVAVLVIVVFSQMVGDRATNIAMPDQASFIEYLEVPGEQVSAITYTNTDTQTTVVWLCGAEVQAGTSEGSS